MNQKLKTTGNIIVHIVQMESKKNMMPFVFLVTRRGTLLIETGLLQDFFGNFSMRGEKYYFYVDKIEPIWGDIEDQNKNPSRGGAWTRWSLVEC